MIRHNQRFSKVVLFINDTTVTLVENAIIWTDDAVSIAKYGENLPRFTIWEDHLCRFFIKENGTLLYLFTGTISEHNINRTQLVYENVDLNQFLVNTN